MEWYWTICEKKITVHTTYSMSLKNMASEKKLTQKNKKFIISFIWNSKTSKSNLCLVTQWCPSLWDLLDCSPPGSSVHRILQASILEQVAIPSFRVSFWPRIKCVSSCLLHCRWILPASPKPEVTYDRKKSEVLQSAGARVECADLQPTLENFWGLSIYSLEWFGFHKCIHFVKTAILCYMKYTICNFI